MHELLFKNYSYEKAFPLFQVHVDSRPLKARPYLDLRCGHALSMGGNGASN